jgi:hypothetical protein
MKSRYWISFVSLFIVLTMVVAPGCRTSPTATISSTSEQPDDVVVTPGGYAYRANVHEQGVPDKWPPIQTVDVKLTSVNNTLQLNYRASIDTKAGLTWNNIFRLSGTSIITIFSVNAVFEPMNLPPGFEANEAQATIGPTTAAVMNIKISPQVKPGTYTFQIHVEIGGKDYGQVPCAITVS